jgi:hypothetical protein
MCSTSVATSRMTELSFRFAWVNQCLGLGLHDHEVKHAFDSGDTADRPAALGAVVGELLQIIDAVPGVVDRLELRSAAGSVVVDVADDTEFGVHHVATEGDIALCSDLGVVRHVSR